MKTKPGLFRSDFRRNVFLVLIAVVIPVTVMIIYSYSSKKYGWKIHSIFSGEDTSKIGTTSIPEDSIEVADGKVPKNDFDNNYSASSWFEKFKANKVAFDQSYKNKLIDVTGAITAIKSEYGCAIIEIQATDSPFEIIQCTNCPAGKDGWSNEVTRVAVQDEVHIRGRYDYNGSSENSMNLYRCHIVE